MTINATNKFVAFFGIFFAVLTVGGAFFGHDELSQLMNPDLIGEWVTDLGPIGPVATAGFMAIAIVFSPLPSAPIALAAGAVYGHIWGTIYVLIGAEIGALAAFWVARYFGRSTVERIIGDRLPKTVISTQNGLTGIVLTARLIPFISFDFVSYAAGLTPLTTTRFAFATLAGMIPVSFLLTHFGAELSSADWQRSTVSLLIVGAVMLIPILWLAKKRKKGIVSKGKSP